MKPLKVAVLVPRSGSNLQVLVDAMTSGSLPIEIVGVISNVKEAYAVTRAEQAGIATAVLFISLKAKMLASAWVSKPLSVMLAPS